MPPPTPSSKQNASLSAGRNPPLMQKCPLQHPLWLVFPTGRVLTTWWATTLSGWPFWGEILLGSAAVPDPWALLCFGGIPEPVPLCAHRQVRQCCGQGAIPLLSSRPHFTAPLVAPFTVPCSWPFRRHLCSPTPFPPSCSKTGSHHVAQSPGPELPIPELMSQSGTS